MYFYSEVEQWFSNQTAQQHRGMIIKRYNNDFLSYALLSLMQSSLNEWVEFHVQEKLANYQALSNIESSIIVPYKFQTVHEEHN